MSSGAAVRLRCPDCRKAIGPLEDTPACPWRRLFYRKRYRVQWHGLKGLPPKRWDV